MVVGVRPRSEAVWRQKMTVVLTPVFPDNLPSGFDPPVLDAHLNLFFLFVELGFEGAHVARKDQNVVGHSSKWYVLRSTIEMPRPRQDQGQCPFQRLPHK